MRTTDQATERFTAEARLRLLTASGLREPAPFPSRPERPGGREALFSEAGGGTGPSYAGAAFGDDPPSAGGDGEVAPGGGPRGGGGPASWLRSAPASPFPPSFEALRTAVAAQGPVLGLSRSGLRALVLVAIVAAAVAGVHLWLSRPESEPLAPPTPISGPPPPFQGTVSRPSSAPLTATVRGGTGPPGVPGAPEVTVHVAGKVRHPGVVTLPGGSRVTDALRAVGGVRGGVSSGSLNLARRLVDGEQIVVGAPRAPGVVGAIAPAPADPSAVVLDLNSATPQQLEQLPGVGEVLAQRIVEYRDGHGGFRGVEQLREISGIGDRKYADLKDRVHV
ncbi:helix-hairpin-helix domain-containing protein [Streptosporangium sp. NPDC001559]|uniref:helix-hairpin-helix domain-containing protein n=1 Tax=Streptosporangium sp. NPDC001559 TaxID=3366187 RepID=UPI0036E0BA67